MNTGKRFEADFKASIPKDAWLYRLRDSPVTYGGMEDSAIRFASDNICDFILYRRGLYLLELKTVSTPSASLTAMFGKFDPDKQRYKKQKHLEDMADAARVDGVSPLVVISYQNTRQTWAIPAADVLEFVHTAIHGGRKSIPQPWCAEHGIRIAQHQLRVNWRYDVDGLLKRLEASP